MKRRNIAELIALCLSGGVASPGVCQSIIANADPMERPAPKLEGVLSVIDGANTSSRPRARTDHNAYPRGSDGRSVKTGSLAFALAGTGLAFQELPDGGIAINAVGIDHGNRRRVNSALRLAQVDTAHQSTGSTSKNSERETAAATEGADLEEIVVRGVAQSYLPDVQTSATGLEMRLIETPQSVSVLTPEMLKISGASNAYEAADLIPGAEKTGVGLGLSNLLLRGQNIGPRINGVKLLTFPDGFAIGRTEFVRGPATVLYGDTGDFGGEINSILKKPMQQYRAEVGAKTGYFNSRRFEGDFTGPLLQEGRLSFRVLGAYDTTATPVRGGLDINNISRMAFGALDYELTPNTHLSVNLYWDHRSLDPGDEGCPLFLDSNKTLQLPTSIPVELYYCGGPGAKSNIRQSFMIAGLEHEFANGWHFKASAARTRSERDFSYLYPFGPVGDPNLGVGPSEALLYTYDRVDHTSELTFSSSLSGDFDLFSRRQKFALGIEVNDTPHPNRKTFLQSLGIGIIDVNRQDLRTFADGSLIPEIDRSQLPVASDSVNTTKNYKFSAQTLLNPFGKLDVLAGVLVQHSDLFQQRVIPLKQPIRTRLTEVIPRLGLTYKIGGGGEILDDSRVYFSFSKGFSPNVGAFGKDGEALTAPQLLTQYEIGWKSQFFKGLFSTNISAYTSRITNVVQTVFTQGQFDQGYSTLTGLSEFKGVEAEALGEILPGWNIALSYGYTETRLKDASFPGLDLRVRSVPKHRATLFSSYEFLRGPLRKLRLGGGVIYKGDYPFIDVSPVEVKTYGQLVASGYTRVDFDASYSGFRSALNGFEVYAHLENAFDVKYYLDLYGYSSLGVTHGPPRTLSVGIRYVFDANKNRSGKIFGGS